MSRLCLAWLNDEICLSRQVNWADFQNGYMLGELLARFNQQTNFKDFKDSVKPAHKLANFCMLEPTMRRVGVHFNSQVVTDIMGGKETTIKVRPMPLYPLT
ncbi:hypothetical protein B484DRAFT_260007 [Ochromonadaceae sp. CCMP2298]|nr:hypothetical protein B484DRAFT_260007 [Ochromonadaceae sp. CCMP2298]